MMPKINKELLPMKAHYFLFNAGTAPVVPNMTPLARQLGFSYSVIGTMYAILPIIGMLAKPLFGFLADRYHRHRLFFLGGEILTALAFFMIMFVPPIEPTIQFHCHRGATDLRYCSNYNATIKQNLEQHYGENTTLECQLNCEAEPYLWDIICQDWLKNATNVNCENIKTQNELNFGTTVRIGDIINLEMAKCMHFIVPHDQGTIMGKNVTMSCPEKKKYFQTNCTLNCHDDFFMKQLTTNSTVTISDAIHLHQFWFFFSMLILSWVGMAVVVSIGDAICFAILGDRPHLYGRQRLCGSLGWGIFSMLAGVLIDQISGDSVDKNYTIAFWMTLIIIGFDVLASTKLNHTQTHLSPNILKDIGQMFLSLRCCIFFLWCIFIGLGTALIWNFLFLYLEKLGTEQSSIKTLEGFVMGIQCFGGELPFFFLSGWILKKIGHTKAMSLILFGFGLRFILYSMLQDPWYVLPIELLNGVTFGLFYATMASYASLVAPPGTEATMQGLVGAIFEGVGVSTGSLIGGLLFDSVGGGRTFEIFGIGAFIAFIIHVCLQMYLQRNHSSSLDGENGKQEVVDSSVATATTTTTTAQQQEILNNINSKNFMPNNRTSSKHDEFTDIDLNN